MKKTLFLLLFAVLALSSAWAYSFSAVAPTGQRLYYTITSSSNRTVSVVPPKTSNPYWSTSYTKPTGSLTIPSTVTYSGKTYSVTSIGERAFYNCSSLASVTIPNSVTSIGNYAFYYCTSLASVSIPNSVTSIGNSAFYNCTSLSSVTIPNSVTSIGNYAFYYCSSLASVSIPNSVTSIGDYAFRSCESLASVTIPNSVTNIGEGAFYWCESLTSVTIGNSVTAIGNSAFYNCRSLSSVTIPNSVTSIGNSAFSFCSSLASVTIPNSVISIGNDAFYLVRNIIYHGTASGSPWGALMVNGYEEGDLFYSDNTKTHLTGCKASATSVNIPNSVTSIGEYAFADCYSLASVTIPNSVTSIGEYAFAACTSLASVTIPNSVTAIGNGAFSSCYSLESITIPNSVTSIGDETFYACESLASVTIPNSVTAIGEFAFEYCTSLASVTIPNSVTAIGYGAFFDCSSLASVTIPNSVTAIGEHAFAACESLASVTIPNSVTSIGEYAFAACTSLASVTIPNSVTAIGNGAFSSCYSLESITIPNSVTSIGDETFYACESLASVTIPNSVTSIGNSAFQSCTSLSHVTFNARNCSDLSSSSYSFPGCTNFSTVTIGDSVQRIPAYLFYGTAITSLTIPNSVTSIGQSAFSGCTGLTEITSKVNVAPQAGTDAFNGVPISIPVYIPCGSSMSYYARWVQFTNFVEHFNFSVQAASDDETMGSAAVTQQPNCSSPTAIVEATPTGNYIFDHWSNGATQNPYTFTVTSDTAITAIFTDTFSAVAPTGQMLYYKITSASDRTVILRGPHFNGATFDWNGYVKPTGSLTIPDTVSYKGTTYSVTSIGYFAFNNCSDLTSVVLPNSVTSLVAYAFYGCSNLTNITIPDSITIIGDHAFLSCSSLISVTLPNTVTDIGRLAFAGCNSLVSVNVPDSITIIQSNTFANCCSLTSITIPSSVTTIRDGGFSDCTSLTEIISKAIVAPTLESDVFNRVPNNIPIYIPCGSLSSYQSDWPQFNNFVERFYFTVQAISANETMGTAAVTQQPDCTTPNAVVQATPANGYFFSHWSNGATQNPYTFTVTSDTAITAIFTDTFSAVVPSGQTLLFRVTSTSNNTVEVISPNDRAPFWSGYTEPAGALAIPSAVTHNGTTYSVTSIKKSAFRNCANLTSVTIPTSVSRIEDSTFASCTRLANVTIPNSIIRIGRSAFYCCTSLTNVVIPNTVTYIGYDAFNSCTGLRNITLSNSITSITASMLRGCRSLTSITIPRSVTSIGGTAFLNCTGLTEIISNASTAPTITANSFRGVHTDVLVYIPCGSLASYQSRWTDFNNFIEPANFSVQVVNDDETMGNVSVTQQPTCSNPDAVVIATPTDGFVFDHWSNGATQNPYTLTVTSDTTLTAYFAAAAMADEASITMVTVEAGHYKVYWIAVNGAAAYNIYREEVVSGNFVQVGTVSAPATNWTDATADPAIRAYRYKISSVDGLGVESELSEAHKTMHLTINQGLDNHTWNLIWTEYEGMEYDSYRIFRGTSENSMSLIDVIPAGGYTTYTDANAGTGSVYYQIDIVQTSSMSKGSEPMPKSNIAKHELGADEYIVETLGNVITVKGCESKMVRIYDVTGRLVVSKADAPSIVELNVGGTGAYLVQVGNSPAQKVVVLGR